MIHNFGKKCFTLALKFLRHLLEEVATAKCVQTDYSPDAVERGAVRAAVVRWRALYFLGLGFQFHNF